MEARLFDVRRLGAQFREISPRHLQRSHSRLRHHWFQGGPDADFFLWTDPSGDILKQQLGFFGQVVEWNVVEGIKTGVVIEQERRLAAASVTVHYDAQPQPAPIEQAVALVEHMAALSEAQRTQILRNFRDPKTSSMPAEEFVRRFGVFIHAPSERVPMPASFWYRAWLWLFRRG